MYRTAVILAGGLGERLKDYTIHLPKPLLPVQGSPILGIILGQLAKRGFGRVILALHYKSDLIKSYCGDGSKWNLCIEYSQEEKRLGTIGPIKSISNLPENFLIMNGDILTDMDLGRFHDRHVVEKNLFTLAYFERHERTEYGMLEIDNQRITGFKEKPTIKQNVNMGIYMANRRVLSYIPHNAFYGLNDLVKKLLEMKEPIAAAPHQGQWIDIGTMETYDLAQSIPVGAL
jgi:NDP-sugar pyrophosphorylase family protein